MWGFCFYLAPFREQNNRTEQDRTHRTHSQRAALTPCPPRTQGEQPQDMSRNHNTAAYMHTPVRKTYIHLYIQTHAYNMIERARHATTHTHKLTKQKQTMHTNTHARTHARERTHSHAHAHAHAHTHAHARTLIQRSLRYRGGAGYHWIVTSAHTHANKPSWHYRQCLHT